MKWSRWRLCAVGAICTHTRWAHPSFLHLSHRWLKPSGKPDLLTLFSELSESWTINKMFCFPAPQVFSPQSLFAFQTYLQIFHGRQICVCRFRSSVLDSFLKTDNSLKTRTWFHDYRSVSSFSLLWCWQFLSKITPHQAGEPSKTTSIQQTCVQPSLTSWQPPAAELENTNTVLLLNIKGWSNYRTLVGFK